MDRGRFAPSPSGALHLGSARTALAAWRDARRRGGAFVLRIEDLDATRTVAGATDAMLEDLQWLGVDWDEGPDCGGPSAPYVQSSRRPLFEAALAQLRADAAIYPCSCSRRDIELATQAPHEAEPIYPRTCRGRRAEDVVAEAAARGRGVSWRFAVGDARVAFEDRVFGRVEQDVARACGDFVVCRADGVPSYQLAVVVDDLAMGITDVVRGADLLASTPRQILLTEALGGLAPRWMHVPLIVGDDGVRLAKRHGSITLRELRARGTDPARLREVLLSSLDGPEGAVSRTPCSLATLRSWVPSLGRSE